LAHFIGVARGTEETDVTMNEGDIGGDVEDSLGYGFCESYELGGCCCLVRVARWLSLEVIQVVERHDSVNRIRAAEGVYEQEGDDDEGKRKRTMVGDVCLQWRDEAWGG
jgi:hypothetical protein